MKKPAYLLLLFAFLFSVVACSESTPATQKEQKVTHDNTVETPEPSATPVSAPANDQLTISETPSTDVTTEPEKVAIQPKEVNHQAPKPVLTVNEPVKPKSSSSKVEKNQAKKIIAEEKKKEEKINIPPKETAKAKEVVEKVVEKPVVKENPAPQSIEKAISHEQWDQLLRKYVSTNGKVNYKGFKADAAKLNEYLKNLQDNPIEKDWSRNQKMAYWINAYNAFTVKLIVDNYPVSSITKLHGGKPWDVSWIKIGGKSYSLNNIENDILRPQYKDARIHFAVNCAARSCPPLLNRAWTAANLNRYFDKQAKAFINNSKFNKLTENSAEISKIFEWYAGDFDEIISYLNKYAATSIKPGTKVTYMEYDWGLNE